MNINFPMADATLNRIISLGWLKDRNKFDDKPENIAVLENPAKIDKIMLC